MNEFLDNIQNSLIFKNFFLVLSGLDNTILLLLISLPLGFVLALLFALGRVSKIKIKIPIFLLYRTKFPFFYFYYLKFPLSTIIGSYIFTIRGTPLLVQIYLIYFGLGSVKFIRESFLWYALKEPFWCGVIALTVNTVAYGAEIFRGGIQSIEKSQVESGLSLGFGKFLLLRKIILPIAIRKVLPSYGNELILMVKATSLVSLTTYMEMTGIARKIMAKTFAPVEAFIAAGILYLFLNFLMVQFVKYLEWKYNPHLRLNN